ncbi:MAG: hypothetical protein ACK4SA_21785, partial [Caldilinea sp.]
TLPKDLLKPRVSMTFSFNKMMGVLSCMRRVPVCKTAGAEDAPLAMRKLSQAGKPKHESQRGKGSRNQDDEKSNRFLLFIVLSFF